MSYLSKVKIVPNDSYHVIRNCPKCGCKTHYINTNNFRVNANGNNIDVWLIYQCEKCKHTYNLTIYERVKPNSIPQESYHKFMANDRELAYIYGNQKKLFMKNRAEVDLEHLSYEIVAEEYKQEHGENGEKVITIYNPYAMKVRIDKVISEILEMSRNKVRTLIKEESIKVSGNYIGKMTQIILNDEV